MTAAWVDRISVVAILLVAAAYLARRVAQRRSTAFGRDAAGVCGPECGCGEPGVTPSRQV